MRLSKRISRNYKNRKSIKNSRKNLRNRTKRRVNKSKNLRKKNTKRRYRTKRGGTNQIRNNEIIPNIHKYEKIPFKNNEAVPNILTISKNTQENEYKKEAINKLIDPFVKLKNIFNDLKDEDELYDENDDDTLDDSRLEILKNLKKLIEQLLEKGEEEKMSLNEGIKIRQLKIIIGGLETIVNDFEEINPKSLAIKVEELEAQLSNFLNKKVSELNVLYNLLTSDTN